MSRAVRLVLAAATVLAYNNWLAWRLNGSPDALRGYLSELAASDQPYAWFFRTGDITAASLFLLVAALGWHRRLGWSGVLGRRWARRAAASLGLVGLATMLDVLMALPCSESRDPQCVLVGQPIWYLHAVTSSSVGIGFFLLFIAVSMGLWRGVPEAAHLPAEHRASPALSATGRLTRRRLAAGVLGLGLGVGCLNLVSGIGPFFVPGVQGLVQPVQVCLCSLFIAALTLLLGSRPERS